MRQVANEGESLYHSGPEGFGVHEFKAVCAHCGKVAGMFSTINAGVSHIAGHSFACLDCLRKRYDEEKIAEDIPGAREFIEALLEAGRGEGSR